MTRNIDASAAPRQHQLDYAAAIGEWEQVLTWSNRHGAREQAEVATKKLESLRQRFAAGTLSKLDREDWFEAQFNSSLAADPEFVAQIENLILEEAKRPARERIESLFGNPNERTPRTVEIIEKLVQADQVLTEITSSAGPVPGPRKLIKPSRDVGGGPQHIKREIWRDRVAVQRRTELSGTRDGATTNKAKEKRGLWAHPSPPPPLDLGWHSAYIEDSLKGLAKAIGATQRVIRDRNQRGTLWVMFVQGKRFRVWFQNKPEHDTCKARHDKAQAALKQRVKGTAQGKHNGA